MPPTRASTLCSSALLPLSVFLPFLLTGCAEETTVISETGLLVGLPEAQRGGKQTTSSGAGRMNPLETVDDAELIRTAPTGERVLICQSPRHVVVLTRRLLASNDESDGVLFYNQLVSDDTKRRAIKEGEDPTRILEYFKENRAEILDLLAAMPMGELSPEVAYEPVDDGSGKDRARLRIRSSLSRKLEFTQLWVQKEGRNQYRLLWVK
jgi:hypothetical protein